MRAKSILESAIGQIANRLTYGWEKAEIEADMSPIIGASLFAWAWQAATYEPKRLRYASWGQNCYQASCTVYLEKG